MSRRVAPGLKSFETAALFHSRGKTFAKVSLMNEGRGRGNLYSDASERAGN